jgi:chromosome segregation ATPase
MAVTEQVNRGSVDYEVLEGEYKACRQHLRSKEQALRILQEQLKKADLNAQRLKQEIKQLRSQLSRSQQVASPVKPENPNSKNAFLLNEELVHEKEVLIQQLEGAQGQVLELERQVAELEDEKGELVSERGFFSAKSESLLKCLEEEKTRQPPSHSALQSLLDENRQLRLTLVEVEGERDHAKGKIERYKRAVERKKVVEAAGSDQALNLADRKQDLRLAVKRIGELESLANSLSQSVKEKSVTITHQKKANKALATKVAELEHQVKVLELSQVLTAKERNSASTLDQDQAGAGDTDRKPDDTCRTLN